MSTPLTREINLEIPAMIRNLLKFNTSVVDFMKNSTGVKLIDQKLATDSLSSFHSSIPLDKSLSRSTGNVTRSVRRFCGLPDSDVSDSDESDAAVAETPTRTELFEIRGPNQTGFLIEVRVEDLQDVRRDLNKLKGAYFHFDKNVIGWFTIKCMLTAEALPSSPKEQQRLARVHAIASGSEEVHKIDNTNFLFVNPADRLMRAKRILEKLGYKISGILYRFQPTEKIDLDDAVRDTCYNFIRAVEELPKVISITHNILLK